jgi:hypothetical protein
MCLRARIVLDGSAKKRCLAQPGKGEELRLRVGVDKLDALGCARRRYRNRTMCEEAKPRKTSERGRPARYLKRTNQRLPAPNRSVRSQELSSPARYWSEYLASCNSIFAATTPDASPSCNDQLASSLYCACHSSSCRRSQEGTPILAEFRAHAERAKTGLIRKRCRRATSRDSGSSRSRTGTKPTRAVSCSRCRSVEICARKAGTSRGMKYS